MKTSGYTLVVLIIAITVLNILLAAMLPLASQAIRREKEEELIFRGFQYAEAIRVYQMRNQGQYPTSLDQLIKTKPRCIRQLWKDPMTDDGKWGLIFLNQNPPLQTQLPTDPNGRNPKDPKREPGEDPKGGGDEAPTFGPRKGDVVAVGPIIGVHSKSNKKSIMIWSGREHYDEWRFTMDLITSQRVEVPGAAVPTGSGMQLSTRWIGRPMRFGNQGMPTGVQDGTMPDGTRPDDTNRPGFKPPNRPQKPKPRSPFQ